MRELIERPGALRLVAKCVMAVAALGCAGQLYGLSCTVTKHRPATDADKAMMAGDYAKAEDLYKAEVAKQPGDGDSELGLIHALLREQRVDSAAVEVASALKAWPKSAALVTARGEVEYRKGELWNVEPTVVASYKLDPCNGRTRLLFARVLEASARYATAKQQYTLAHEFDPENPEIKLAWIQTLPAAQRAAELEAFLASPNGTDAMEQGALKAELNRLKLIKDQPGHECKLVSGGPTGEIPFIRLAGWGGRTRAYGIEVGLNGAPTRLQIDTRGQGLTVYRAAAEHAGLKRIGEEDKNAAAGPMGKPNYTVLADLVKVGGLEFKDCEVNVIDGSGPFDDGAGFIGMDVFSKFMVTVDFPMRTLGVGPLAARPGAPAPTAQLVTIAADWDPVAGSPEDRYIAPELKDYTQVYRVGHDTLLPTALSSDNIKLFVPDDAQGTTGISAAAASEVTKISVEAGMKYADLVSFNFAHVGQKLANVPITDTSMASKMDGTEVAGFLGNNMLTQFTLHIDYRDGLLKADYVPGRGYKFEDNSSHP
jgi:tetratricopeptide (TPR) repeat protein